MTTEDDDIAVALSLRYGDLSVGQRRAIDRLLSDGRYGAVVSAAELASDAGVSEATVTRAAQALGFEGFPDLRARLRDRLIRPVSDRLDRSTASATDAPEVVALRVLIEDSDDIRATAEDLSPDVLRAALETLASARRTYVFAARGSHGLATIFAIGARLVLPDVRLLSQAAGDLPDQLIGMTADDTLIAFSFRRLDVITVKVLEVSKRQGASTIAVTDVVSNEATRVADVALSVRLGRLRLQPSFAPGASVVNALLTALALRLGPDNRERLRQAEALWQEFGTHLPDAPPPPRRRASG